jgi:hypothetical protein
MPSGSDALGFCRTMMALSVYAVWYLRHGDDGTDEGAVGLPQLIQKES